jgi:hypothetical protein
MLFQSGLYGLLGAERSQTSPRKLGSAIYATLCPGCLSTQLYRGVANSDVVINYAAWESAEALRKCLHSEELKAMIRDFPAGTECKAQISQKLRVEGACAGDVDAQWLETGDVEGVFVAEVLA